MTLTIELDDLTPDAIPDAEIVEVRTLSDTFRLRRRGPLKKRHHYQVWHAFHWEQQELTGTQWRVCTNFESAINLMQRHSDDQDS